MTRIIVAAFLIPFLLPGFVLSQDYQAETVRRTLYSAYNACKPDPVLKKGGDLSQLQQLLDAGYPIDAVVFDRQTLLIMSCGDPHPAENQVEIVEMLLNKGANPNIQCKSQSSAKFHDEGQTALMKAVKSTGFLIDPRTGNYDKTGKQKQAQLEIVQLLLKAGADVNIRDEKGMTALQYALQSRDAKYLVNVLTQAQQKSKR